MLRAFQSDKPEISDNVYIDETAVITGKVTVDSNSSVFAFTAIRGDDNAVIIGKRTNIQEHVTIHESLTIPTIIGDGVSVGHGAILHGCSIGDNVLVGMHATVLDGVVVNENSIVAAGSVCTPNKVYPPNSMIMGSPAKVVRELREEELEQIRKNAEHYVTVSAIYLSQQNKQ